MDRSMWIPSVLRRLYCAKHWHFTTSEHYLPWPQLVSGIRVSLCLTRSSPSLLTLACDLTTLLPAVYAWSAHLLLTLILWPCILPYYACQVPADWSFSYLAPARLPCPSNQSSVCQASDSLSSSPVPPAPTRCLCHLTQTWGSTSYLPAQIYG